MKTLAENNDGSWKNTYKIAPKKCPECGAAMHDTGAGDSPIGIIIDRICDHACGYADNIVEVSYA